MGKYYKDMWNAAIQANPLVIAITSFNEWGEGTQIEAAQVEILKRHPSINLLYGMTTALTFENFWQSGRVSARSGYRYQEYGRDEMLYMRLTKTLSLQFRDALSHRNLHLKQAVRDALISENRRLHTMLQALAYQAHELYKESKESKEIKQDKDKSSAAQEQARGEGSQDKDKVQDLVEIPKSQLAVKPY